MHIYVLHTSYPTSLLYSTGGTPVKGETGLEHPGATLKLLNSTARHAHTTHPPHITITASPFRPLPHIASGPHRSINKMKEKAII